MYQNLAKKHHQKLMDEESELSNSASISEQKSASNSLLDLENSKVQHQVIIENTPVFFPHSPYNVQIEYMKNVIQALDKKQNALLESPTGTGKTLSLLCALLAWLEKSRHDQNKQNTPRNLKIIYASRTHAQLKQVAQELKKTGYKPNVAILGSRDQYCIQNCFKHIKGVELIQICENQRKQDTCIFKKKNSPYLAASHSKQLYSLEEAKQFGQQNKCCPYFFERERARIADLILLPYNYLLDMNTMDSVNIQNSILIFDEGHNVQKAAEDGFSFKISLADVEKAEKDLEELIKVLQNTGNQFEKVNEYNSIRITLEMFGNYLKEQQNQMTAIKTKDGRDIFEVIEQNTRQKQFPSTYENGLNANNINTYTKYCLDLIQIMREHSITHYQFESWTKFIQKISDLYQSENKIQVQRVKSLKNPVNQYKLAFELDRKQFVLHMWCLDPSVAFKRLLQKNIHSIILTSGTLAPFQSWAFELRVDFPITLENNHIINVKQNLRVFQNKSLDFSFQQRKNEEQIDTLGVSLLNLCRVIPNGILVIFSSYELMNILTEQWEKSEILEKIQEIKDCFWEPKISDQMQNVFENYTQSANTGAIMFAVQRGKVAEGIDFSDELCRAVFLIGVPYPSIKDERIIQKNGYLDQLFSDQGYSAKERPKKIKDWSNQSAIRATNQALGRVIRHVKDYGIVFLCDKNFGQGLSKWANQGIIHYRDENEIINNITEFFLSNQPNQIIQQNQQIQKQEPSFSNIQQMQPQQYPHAQQRNQNNNIQNLENQQGSQTQVKQQEICQQEIQSDQQEVDEETLPFQLTQPEQKTMKFSVFKTLQWLVVSLSQKMLQIFFRSKVIAQSPQQSSNDVSINQPPQLRNFQDEPEYHQRKKKKLNENQYKY